MKARQSSALNLPRSLSEAVELAAQSELLKTVIPERTINFYLDAKRAEARKIEQSQEHASLEQKLHLPYM